MTEKEFEIQKALGLVPKDAFLYLCNNLHHNHHGYGRYDNITPHTTDTSDTSDTPPRDLAYSYCLICKRGFYHNKNTRLTVKVYGDNNDDD